MDALSNKRNKETFSCIKMKTDLSDKMKNEAVSLGLCAQWTAEWQDHTSKDDMVEKFVNGIDFCIGRNWPSPKDMKKYFGDVIHRHGVYVDENVELHNPKIAILNGECVGHIGYEWMDNGEIYARHETSLYLKVKGFSRVFVNLLDNAELHVDCEDTAKCFVYQYGGIIKTASGNVIIRDRKQFKF